MQHQLCRSVWRRKHKRVSKGWLVRLQICRQRDSGPVSLLSAIKTNLDSDSSKAELMLTSRFAQTLLDFASHYLQGDIVVDLHDDGHFIQPAFSHASIPGCSSIAKIFPPFPGVRRHCIGQASRSEIEYFKNRGSAKYRVFFRIFCRVDSTSTVMLPPSACRLFSRSGSLPYSSGHTSAKVRCLRFAHHTIDEVFWYGTAVVIAGDEVDEHAGGYTLRGRHIWSFTGLVGAGSGAV